MKAKVFAAVLAAASLAATPLVSHRTQAPPAGTGAQPPAAAREGLVADTMSARRFTGRTRGSSRAPVTVYELSDFQCRYCRQSALETFPALDRLYVRTGKVRWVFMNYPKPRSHRHAIRSAEFALCAAQGGRFWEMHDALFARQPEWAPLQEADPVFFAIADSLRLNRRRLSRCLESGTARASIEADLAYPRALGIGGVPAFVVDDRMVVQGAQPQAVFVAKLDSIIAAKAAAGCQVRATQCEG